MKVLEAPVLEHREESRVATSTRARLEVPGAAAPVVAPVVIEEMSACGLRLSSEVPLHPNETLLLRVPGQALPLHARVVWLKARKSGHCRDRKTWVAGCRLEGESIGQAKLPIPPDAWVRRGPVRGKAVLAAAGVLGLMAVVLYLYLKFVQFLGETPRIPH